MGMRMELPEDLITSLLRLEDEDFEIECLEVIQDDLVDSVKKELSKHDLTGDLVRSVKAKAITKNKNTDGYHVTAMPTGYSKNTYNYFSKKKGIRKYKVTNVAKAVWLEYGTSKQSAKPWLDKARKNVEPIVTQKWQELINKRIGG